MSRDATFTLRKMTEAPVRWMQQASCRVDAVLTSDRIRVYPAMVAVMMAVVLVASAVLGKPPFDAFGKPLAVDLTAHYTAGRIVLDGDPKRLYDLGYQKEVLQGILGAGHESFMDIYLSPPFVAWLYAPLAALPYLTAATLWTVLTIVLLVLSFRLFWPLVPGLHRYRFGFILLLLFSAQPVFELLGDGQDSAISLLLLVVGLRLLLARRDLLAGGILGLGFFKPQLFILIPILLLLRRRWHALTSWIAVVLVLSGISLALVGPGGIRSYIALLTSDTYTVKISNGFDWKMQSLTALARVVVPIPGMLVVGLVLLVAGVIALFVLAQTASRSSEDSRSFTMLYGMTILLTTLVNPHLFLYDCVVFFLPSLILASEALGRRAVRVALAAAYVLTWTSPVRYVLIGNTPWPISILAGPWSVLALVALLMVARQLLLIPQIPVAWPGPVTQSGSPTKGEPVPEVTVR